LNGSINRQIAWIRIARHHGVPNRAQSAAFDPRNSLSLDQHSLPHPIVSGGSTAYALQAHEIPELTEYRIGEYPVGGYGHLLAGRHKVEQCALR